MNAARIEARTRLLNDRFYNGTIGPEALKELARLRRQPVAELRKQLVRIRQELSCAPPPPM